MVRSDRGHAERGIPHQTVYRSIPFNNFHEDAIENTQTMPTDKNDCRSFHMIHILDTFLPLHSAPEGMDNSADDARMSIQDIRQDTGKADPVRLFRYKKYNSVS